MGWESPQPPHTPPPGADSQRRGSALSGDLGLSPWEVSPGNAGTDPAPLAAGLAQGRLPVPPINHGPVKVNVTEPAAFLPSAVIF